MLVVMLKGLMQPMTLVMMQIVMLVVMMNPNMRVVMDNDDDEG